MSEKSGSKERPRKITRRQAIGAGIAGAVLVAGGAAAYYFGSKGPTPLNMTTPSVTGPSVTTQAGKPVVFGTTIPLTGYLGADGQLYLEGYELAIEKINAEGGILGRPAALKVYDDTGDTSKVGPLFTRLIVEDKVDFVTAPYGSFLTFPALPAVANQSYYMFATGSIALPKGQESPYYINAWNATGKAAGGYHEQLLQMFKNFDQWNYQNKPKPTKVSFLFANNPYGLGLSNDWAPQWKDIGFDIVYQDFYDPSIMDYTPIIAKVMAAAPDVAFFSTYFQGGVQLQKQWIQQKAHAEFVSNEAGLYTDYFGKPDAGGVTSDVSEGVMSFFAMTGVSSYHGGWADWLRQTYKDRFNAVPAGFGSACTFATAELLVCAANLSGTLDQDTMVKTMKSQQIDTAMGSVNR